MSPSARRRACALATTLAAVGMLAWAQGALAATLTVDGSGNLVYTAAAGKTSAVEFVETAADTVQVHAVSGGNIAIGFSNVGPFVDDDTIAPSGNCTADAAPDANGDPTWTCTGVTGSIQATTLDGADAVDGSGSLTGLPGAALTSIPLVADMGDDADAVAGGHADDTLHGGAGDDHVFGDDSSPTSGSNDSLFGDAGEDTVVGGKGTDAVDGGTEDDRDLIGGPGADTISGGDGNDDILGGSGSDTVDGGAGEDAVNGDCSGNCGAGGTDGHGNDVLDGGGGEDRVRGEQGDDTVAGGAGNDDEVAGGPGDDTVRGGDGDEGRIAGGPGDDIVDGGAGDDYVSGDCGGVNFCGNGSDGDDSVAGGSGVDRTDADAGTDTIDLGGGLDLVVYQARVELCDPGCELVAQPVSVTLDGAANDGAAGENDTVLGVEDVEIESACCGDVAAGSATVVGDAGTNWLAGADGDDTLDGGAGNDFLYGLEGDDTLDANDAFADRVSCGPGNDTANVDEFDAVGDDCEVVNRTTRGDLATEDAPPAVTWTAPASQAQMSTSAPNALTVAVTDDKGISQVVFLAGERVICTVTAAPYTCSYAPTEGDVGRTTLTAVAVDTNQQTASANRVVNVARFKPSKLTSRTRPKKDAKAPFKFTTRGRLSLPAGVTEAVGCNGTVVVTFKAGKKKLATREARVSETCTYRAKVTIRLPARRRPQSLRVKARFGGNAVLSSRAAKRASVKLG